MGGTTLSKSITQFSVDGWNCVPFLLFTWVQTMVEVMKIMRINLLQKIPSCIATLTAPNPAASYHRPMLSLETPGHFRVNLGHSLVGVTVPFSWVLVHTRFCLCPPRVYFPVLCKFWQLYGGVNGDLLQEGLCHTQVCCTQSPIPVAVHC